MSPTVSPAPISGRARLPRAFTLIEIIIVVLILGLLAAIVLAQVGNLIGTGRAEALAGTVTHVRELINYRAGAGEPPLDASGFPTTIDGSWFTRNQIPEHTWTQLPMVVQVVASPANQIYPAIKTFDPGDPAAENAWYNVNNGAFAVRIGDFGDVNENIDAFNQANLARITSLAQITFD
ncbi:MAG: prepilin-type N-terminal cleavage/methylation domain-containing protein [Phycisphaerales bacterium]|nr:prepilin-type N-terminal cleavage/methylation domain-containing protein [Phycisphaerae bacterium]NNF42570.1 prepilin-type N-terminal cleavage/methylation domain-containing protein [Phycisphaerales bacterium]NNM25591.1 prepilin-type N-terminal cleavage/methylation domain-containing protein [Phycisphaerales bacterium]